MRWLVALAVAMAVLIVAGVAVIGVTIMHRMSGPVAAAPTMLDEPAGTAIAEVSTSGDRVALLLHGGGPDRVVLIDARSGAVLGRTSLAH
jgi:hypothetical protein